MFDCGKDLLKGLNNIMGFVESIGNVEKWRKGEKEKVLWDE